MRMLSGKLGERFRISNDVDIVVLGIVGTKVRLGVTAPHRVVLNRQKVCDIEGPATKQECQSALDAD